MITYDIDRKQPKKSKKRILEAKKSKLFLIALLFLVLVFYLIFKVEGV